MRQKTWIHKIYAGLGIFFMLNSFCSCVIQMYMWLFLCRYIGYVGLCHSYANVYVVAYSVLLFTIYLKKDILYERKTQIHIKNGWKNQMKKKYSQQIGTYKKCISPQQPSAKK